MTKARNIADIASDGSPLADGVINYGDITGLPTLGTVASTAATDYATAAQGALADTATQPADVATAISNLVDTAPSTLDTLNELAAALGDDPNFATTVTNSIATKLPLAGGTLTGGLNVTSGNVGIGTSSIGSSTKLQVAGRGLFTDGAIDPADGSPAGVTVGYNIAGDHGFIQSIHTGVANKPLYIQPNNSNVYISPNGGNVGIGTSSPLSKLNAKGTQGNWRVDPDSVSGEIQVLATTTTNDGFRDFRIRTQQTIFDTAGSERMRIDSSGGLITKPAVGGHAVFNEDGVDADFRIESDTNANALFVQGSDGKVGIGKVPAQKFEVEGGRSIFTDANSNFSIGVKNKAGNYPMYIGATDSLLTPSLQFSAATGSPLMYLTYGGGLITNPSAGGHAVFNEGGVDADFRVESDGNTHALFVDAGYNAVGIANAAPRAPLDIRSTIGAHSLVAGFIRATSNAAVNILTVSGQPSNCGVAIYARLVAASAVTNNAAVIEFWAALTKQNYGADNATAVAPVVSKAIVGTAIGAGSLAWSGKTLQYTPDCGVNYVGYQMEIQVVTNDSATITINAVI